MISGVRNSGRQGGRALRAVLPPRWRCATSGCGQGRGEVAQKKRKNGNAGKRSSRRGTRGANDLHADFEAPLRALLDWERATKTPFAVVGGVAVGVRARPRATEDIDIVIICELEPAPLLESLSRFGFKAARKDSIAVASERRVLPILHTESGIPVDVMLGKLPYEEEIVYGATRVPVAGMRLPVIRHEALCVMKLLAQRTQDLADLESLLTANPRLNRKEVLETISGLAALLEEPELLASARRILDSHRPGQSEGG
jgi:hypothetical protein